jgi:cytochrome c oxidase subunit 2
MAEEETTREGARARTPEEVRPKGQASVAQMLIIGAIASALGIALGLIIDWFPTPASTQAGPIDTLYDVLVIISVPVFVLVTVVVLFSVWKFRQRPGEEFADGPPIHGNTRLEVIWTAIPAIVLVALCTYSYVVLTDIEEAKANEMRINVIGQQFAWTFEYPQATGEPIRTTQLYLPEDRPVRFYVSSRDVIHDFWVPAFRMKIDAVPGIDTTYRVTPNRRGRYPVVCAELCGLGHALMRQTANVVTPDEFTAWMDKQLQPEQPAEGGGEGGAPADGKTLFTQGNGQSTACGACHTLADAGTSGSSGPDLDASLQGRDAEYIERGIVEPDAEIAQGYNPGIMPKNYGQTLSPEELDALVSYLEEAAGG